MRLVVSTGHRQPTANSSNIVEYFQRLINVILAFSWQTIINLGNEIDILDD